MIAVKNRFSKAETQTAAKELWWWVFVVLACAQFTIRLVWQGDSFLDLRQYAEGNAALPFQGRVLMSWVLRSTADNQLVSTLLAKLAARFPYAHHLNDPYSLVLLVVDFAALLAAVVAARLTLKHLTGEPVFSAWGSLLLLYMSYFNLIVGYGIYMMPYDVVSLAVFSVSLWLILTNRYLALLPLFVVGTLNRETTLFIPIFLGVYTWFCRSEEDSKKQRTPWIVVASHIATQITIWISIRLWIQRRFHNNLHGPGLTSKLLALQLGHNLLSLLKPLQWPLFLSLFGFTLPLFVAKFRMIGHTALAKSTATILVLWASAMMLVGVIVEIRIFNELTAFMTPCVALILWNDWLRPDRLTSTES